MVGLRIKGTWYFFDNNGVMQTGWVFTGGAWYSLNGDGAMRTGWYRRGIHGTIYLTKEICKQDGQK